MSHSMHNHGQGSQSIHTGTGDLYNTITNIHQPHRPSIYVIPYPRNEDVVYRQGLVTALHQLFPPTSDYCSAALYGLGGSGKTQLALQFAFNRGNDRDHSIFWVHADSEATFTHDYKQIAKKLEIDGSVDGEDLLKAVRGAIESRAPWVLVLDNADDLALFGVSQYNQKENRSLYEYIPKAPGGVVLWTSRDARIAGTLVGAQRAIEVRSMTADEARRLLASVTSIGDEEERSRGALLEELQYFPLAISQAGAYMQETSTTVEEYLGLLKQAQDRWDILKESKFDRHRRPEVPNSVLETWRISIERIGQENMIAHRILHAIAYIDSQNLTPELIAAICRDGTTAAMGQENDERKIKKATTLLMKFSFLSEYRSRQSGPSYEVHKLVQEATQYMLKMPGLEESTRGSRGDEQYASIAIGAVNDVFPVSRQDTWGVCEKYVVHAVRVEEWAGVCEKQVEVANLLSRVSHFFHDRGRWWEKEPVDLRALALRREVFGENHPDTISNMASLAATYSMQGRYSEAEGLQKQALALQQQVLGENHPDTITSMRELAAMYHNQGQYSEAESLIQQALALQQQVLRQNHPDTIRSMEGLAAIYHNQGQYSKAEGLRKQVLALRQQVFRQNHPEIIRSIADLATTYSMQGRYSKAEGLHQQALALRQQVLGENHPDTITSMRELAAMYYNQGQYSKAEGFFQQALALRQQVLRQNHPDTIRSIADLAVIYSIQGQYSEAEGLFQQALALRRQVLGENHPDTITSMADLATINQALILRQKITRSMFYSAFRYIFG